MATSDDSDRASSSSSSPSTPLLRPHHPLALQASAHHPASSSSSSHSSDDEEEEDDHEVREPSSEVEHEAGSEYPSSDGGDEDEDAEGEEEEEEVVEEMEVDTSGGNDTMMKPSMMESSNPVSSYSHYVEPRAPLAFSTQPTPTSHISRPLSPTSSPSAPSMLYPSSVSQRLQTYLSMFPSPLSPPPITYTFPSLLLSIPHSSPIHCFSLPPTLDHLLTGGQDGWIRRFNFWESVNGLGEEGGRRENLMMRQSGTGRRDDDDEADGVGNKEGDDSAGSGNQPVLIGYWENEEVEAREFDEEVPDKPPGEDVKDGETKSLPVKKKKLMSWNWGPKTFPMDSRNHVSPVYSLAVESQEMWGLSGTEVII
jgi:hypothetical protein